MPWGGIRMTNPEPPRISGRHAQRRLLGRRLLGRPGIVVAAVLAAIGLAVAAVALATSLTRSSPSGPGAADRSGDAGVSRGPTRRITVCGQWLCQDGVRWYFYGASVYGGYAQPERAVALATSARLNVIRISDFLDSAAPLSAALDEAQWRRVDAMIAAAGRAGLHVELDLSTYRNLLQSNRVNPYTHDWLPFLRFVTGRVNTVDGRPYRNDPTVAVIALAGEVDQPITGSNPLGITSEQVTSFFGRSLGQLAELDPGVLRSTGGLLHLESDSGIDWRTIMSDPQNQICEIHNYSQGDRTATSLVAAYCAGLGKPWLTEEFGLNQTDGDARRSGEFQSMFDLQTQNGSAGVAFWNLGFELIDVDGKTDTFDVNPGTPLTFKTVQDNAPPPNTS
jgi:hypothetical protein